MIARRQTQAAVVLAIASALVAVFLAKAEPAQAEELSACEQYGLGRIADGSYSGAWTCANNVYSDTSSSVAISSTGTPESATESSSADKTEPRSAGATEPGSATTDSGTVTTAAVGDHYYSANDYIAWRYYWDGTKKADFKATLYMSLNGRSIRWMTSIVRISGLTTSFDTFRVQCKESQWGPDPVCGWAWGDYISSSTSTTRGDGKVTVGSTAFKSGWYNNAPVSDSNEYYLTLGAFAAPTGYPRTAMATLHSRWIYCYGNDRCFFAD